MQGCYLDDQALFRAIELLKAHDPKEIDRAIDASDHHAQNLFAPVNSMAGGRWTSLGNPVDWSCNPTRDPEFTWLINRFWHLKDLGLAWLATGNRAYADTFKSHVDGWIAQNPVPWNESWEQATHFQRPGPWRLLETGLRAESLLLGWQFFAQEFASDTEFTARFHGTLADHADWLSMRLGSAEINHAMMHMLGLLAISAALPEHPRANWWRQLAMERFSLCLYRQVGPDGVHLELTPGYHNVAIELFVKPCLIGRRSSHPMPEWFEKRVLEMANFTAASLRSDGKTSAISDWEADHCGRVALAQLGLLSGNDTLIAQGIWSPGLLWLFGPDAWHKVMALTPSAHPQTETVGFPLSGYYVMRNAKNSILFDAAEMGGPHGHADALSFEWTCGPHPLVLDPGRYTYEEGDWRRWFKGTRAHSTVEIDHADQSVYASTQSWADPTAHTRTLRWAVEEDFDFCDACHDGYMRLPQAVSHRRWFVFLKKLDAIVIVDWLEGQGIHHFAQRLMLAPAVRFEVHPASGAGITEADILLADNANRLGITTLAAGNLSSGPVLEAEAAWFSERYAYKNETRALKHSGQFTGSCTLLCVIQRTAPDQAATALAPSIDLARKRVAIDFDLAGATQTFVLDEQHAGWQR
ncbi:MAG: heparinase [Proteobacteria bacterium]|nr:heparinase [Pseudomonadota bacterium]